MEASTTQVAAHVQEAAAQAATAATQAASAAQAAQSAQDTSKQVQDQLQQVLSNVTVGDPTTKFLIWEQAPAWCLWAAALGLGLVMVLKGYNETAGWTFVSIALFVGVILSYRTKFSLGGPPSTTDSTDGSDGQGG